ncbi:hypothetical protein C8F01DRAFT_1331362 [Mycena amicta]|nr:hypothetical protein C8F01DRAFT_1331362 [Mycena amicta]
MHVFDGALSSSHTHHLRVNNAPDSPTFLNTSYRSLLHPPADAFRIFCEQARTRDGDTSRPPSGELPQGWDAYLYALCKITDAESSPTRHRRSPSSKTTSRATVPWASPRRATSAVWMVTSALGLYFINTHSLPLRTPATAPTTKPAPEVNSPEEAAAEDTVAAPSAIAAARWTTSRVRALMLGPAAAAAAEAMAGLAMAAVAVEVEMDSVSLWASGDRRVVEQRSYEWRQD